MIRHGEYKDIPGLKALWAEVFGDEMEFIDSFFEHVFSGEDTLCYEEQGKVRAMLYQIPCMLECGDKSRKGYYFYALATKENFRGRGIMGKMIEYAMEEIRQEEEAVAFLIPAEEELKKYYEKFGFYPLKNTMAQDMELVAAEDGGKCESGKESVWKVHFARSVQAFLQKQRAGLKESAELKASADFKEHTSRPLSVCATKPIDMLQGLIPM